MASVYHDGEKSVQQRAGVRAMAERVGNGIHPQIPPAAVDFLTEQPFAVLGATDASGRVWAALLLGKPGFLHPVNETTVHIDATLPPSDPLFAEFQSGSAVAVGLLVIEPATRRRMRLNGKATLLADGNGIAVQAEQVYANCPKYIQKRELTSLTPGATVTSEQSPALSPTQRNWIQNADTFFIATAHPDAGADASHRGGNPGFVRLSEDGQTLYWGDFSGNMMFNTLGNIAANPNTGLLFVDFDRTGNVLQLTGKARILWDTEAHQVAPEGERAIAFTIESVVETHGAFPFHYDFVEFSKFNP